MVRLGLCVLLLFAACAAASTGQLPPGYTGPTEPLPPPVVPVPGAPSLPAAPPTQPPPFGAAPGADQGADADFGNAKASFDRGEREPARGALEAFVARHPDHPSRPAAEMMLARLALMRGDAATAKTLLDPL